MSKTGTGVVRRLESSTRVEHYDVSLIRNGTSVKHCVPLRAIRKAGRDEHNPGVVDGFFIPSTGLFVLDLGGVLEEGEL